MKVYVPVSGRNVHRLGSALRSYTQANKCYALLLGVNVGFSGFEDGWECLGSCQWSKGQVFFIPFYRDVSYICICGM